MGVTYDCYFYLLTLNMGPNPIWQTITDALYIHACMQLWPSDFGGRDHLPFIDHLRSTYDKPQV
jgi:hypothetical protein